MQNYRITVSVIGLAFVCVLIGAAIIFSTGGREGAPGLSDQDVLRAAEQPREAKKIDRGFVFVNGKYIAAPYRVSVNKGYLYVNDTRIRRLCDWPVKERPRQEGKPQIPPEVLENAESFDDLRISDGDSWSARMNRWIKRTSSSWEEMRKRKTSFYESLPFVERVVWTRPTLCKVMLKNGQTKRFGVVGGPGMDRRPPTKEEILERAEYEKKRLEERLSKGDTYLYFGNLEASFVERKAARDLGVMVDILISDRKNEEKIDLLDRMGVIPKWQAKDVEPYLNNFRLTDQLKRRIAELQKKTDVEPRSIQDLPDMNPGELERQRLIEAQTSQPE